MVPFVLIGSLDLAVQISVLFWLFHCGYTILRTGDRFNLGVRRWDITDLYCMDHDTGGGGRGKLYEEGGAP